MDLSKVGGMAMSGIFSVAGPQLVGGMLGEWVKTLTVPMVCEWVSQDKHLWDNLNGEWKAKLVMWGPKLGDTKWLTAEWLVKECRNDNPAVVSLFINWDKAHQWLNCELDLLRENIYKKAVPVYKMSAPKIAEIKKVDPPEEESPIDNVSETAIT